MKTDIKPGDEPVTIKVRWRRYGKTGGRWRADLPPGNGIDSGWVESSSLRTVELLAANVAEKYGYEITYDEEPVSTPEEMAEYKAMAKHRSAQQLADLDEDTRRHLERLATVLHQIETGILGDDLAGDRQAVQLGYLRGSAMAVLMDFGLYRDPEARP